MASVTGGPGEGEEVPAGFRRAVEGLRAARLRPEVELSPLPPPRRPAPYSFALAGAVGGQHAAPGATAHLLGAPVGGPAEEGAGGAGVEDAASGRFVLLYDPAEPEGWGGAFRVVTLTRAELEPEMGGDPMLAEVGWSWLTDALAAHRAPYGELGGTITRCFSHSFGELSVRGATTEIEIRASWSPLGEDLSAHLAAWGDLLAIAAGLPPAGEVPPEPPEGGGGPAVPGPVPSGRGATGVVRLPHGGGRRPGRR
ncbi:DUF3000 domain-containing protein [Allostreptomyces psammosilenae]|uniref:DUF3000 domain-containing protein n=1 Tax=Allostreptomyces psammosilenae TaxID=1892865 RepID=A0A852ZQU4_9ACTN|nr:DUF3000 domain-containing protein [Allostreptomyces psammosilenae]NYI03224.1 hypothetical protein [Allostreptomyces psammosilenae]